MLGILEKFRRDLQAASLAPLSRHQIGLALGLLHDALVMLEQEVAVRRACKFAAAGDAGSLARSLVLLRGLAWRADAVARGGECRACGLCGAAADSRC